MVLSGHLAAQAPPLPQPLPFSDHTGFTQVFAGGADPITTVGAVIDGIRSNRFLISDDETLLATWGAHPADLAKGAAPLWPPR